MNDALPAPRRGAPARRLAALALTGAVALGAAAGCGPKHADAPPVTGVETPKIVDGVQVFTVVGLADLRFNVAELDAKPGKVRIDFSVEDGSASHNFVIPKIPQAHTDITGAGTSTSVTFTVTEPGTYPAICTLHPNMTTMLKVS